MGIEDELSQIVNRRDHFSLTITPGEAILLDWIFTLHSWDKELEDRLSKKIFLRERIALAVAWEKEIDLSLEEDEIKELLIWVPIIWRLGQEDVGFSLKQKLYRLLCPEPPPEPAREEEKEEVANASTSNDGDPNPYDPGDPPPYIARAEPGGAVEPSEAVPPTDG